ncbi:sulfite exporter TauE/SafE family protein [Helicobacter burdigaliensis]|uniref:sulfite exporter TauE/SafE family protein n=1 Tax=Helicobacter burdigaliensis TaxID=2315334 RepID=UPI001E5B35C2|nr:sulfite exporter TauE/SafE family protein [Helicobacter burdigaliensis]
MGETINHLSLIAIFGIALIGSFGHCIGMCGGIVLAYCAKMGKSQKSKLELAFLHLLYNLGRISTYILLGILVGFLGKLFVFNAYFKGILFIFAGVIMILAALSLLGKIKFLTLIEHSLQEQKWYQKSFKKFLALNSPLSLYFLGFLNGLLPCGFVYVYLAYAAASSSPFMGGIIMGVFGLGTIPALFIMGFLANSLLNNDKLRKVALRLSALAIIVFAGFMLQKGYMFLTNPNITHKMHNMEHTPKDTHGKLS